jgi:hypothetical protein
LVLLIARKPDQRSRPERSGKYPNYVNSAIDRDFVGFVRFLRPFRVHCHRSPLRRHGTRPLRLIIATWVPGSRV